MLNRVAEGDKDALRELYDSMSKDIYIFLLMFCKNRYTVEDALQETFISIYENAKTFRKSTNLKAWILTIAKNKVISIMRKNSHADYMTNLDLGKNTMDFPSVEDNIFDKMQADALLSVLSEEDRQIVILHIVYGLKHREIAEIIAIPLGTVTYRYKMSLEKMKKADKSGEAYKQNFFKDSENNLEVIL